MGICFLSVPAVSDSVASIVEPRFGMFGDEVVITVVSSAGCFSPALELLFMSEEASVVERVPVTVVSSTTVYASISKLDIEPGMYTLALDISAEEPLLLDASFMVQPSKIEEIEQKDPLIEVIILETIKPIDAKTEGKEPLIDVVIFETGAHYE